ncbi:cytochrome c [Pedobacter sp. CG_S7]|uniref:PQQ-dependent sugar dehydrogenase n=1 Tax=Pedobacter sp. CG_S7 TaxID=3143930 RepID=UPI0033922EB3
MKRDYYFILMLCSFFVISCKPSRNKVSILYFSTQNEQSGNLKKFSASKGWKNINSEDPSVFAADSLKNISAIVLNVSDINKLDHRELPKLKRYLEAGGGGIIAIRDTLLAEKGWPWLQSWFEREDGALFKQDEGSLSIIGADFSPDKLTAAFDFVIGGNNLPDYSKTITLNVPDSSRYTREVLVESLDEPLQMAILPNRDVLFIERKGGVKLYENITGETKTVANLNIFSGIEDGLLGVAADPGFAENHWVYFYFAVGGEKAVNHLSRFELYGDSLVLGSEKVILEIPTQRIYCCHSAGYIAFDKNGLLYLSTGDNTNAEETEGYTPIDERPGRSLADDQATAANTNDLRGKILRIKPLPDGSYKIPKGNLFPADGKVGRPEIYVMGSRNPFRFSVDPKNNYLYWGDVGPDTKVKASTGEFMSFDEVNQAREPGFFGWPYFLGNNEIFPKYNYATKKEDQGKDPLKPINNSPNNTGLQELPPAKPAMIWYGKSNSKKFPLVGNGGASIMAGPVFYSSEYADKPYKLAEYYDGKLFIFEWIRGWIMAVTLDEKGNYLRMEPFLEHIKFEAPVDIQFAKDGSIYVLEYGTNWFSKNTNAKLVRIQYVEGNRNPKANIKTDKQYGAAPMEVKLSGKGSNDVDGDQLSYDWEIESNKLKGENITYTFNKPGTYNVVLSVKDNNGGVGETTSKMYVGNTPPEVFIQTKANRSFYWDNSVLDYTIDVQDKEEKINPKRLNISFGYIPHGKDAAIILTGNQELSNFKYLKGKQMVASFDCKSCHSMDQASAGPSYFAIAERYAAKNGVLKQLSAKVINGGSGNWGERSMSPHPAISNKEAEEMVAYILSLANKKNSLPLKDVIKLSDHLDKGNEGVYLLNATYKDQGANGIGELQSRNYILLKSPVVQAEDFDEGNVRISTITTAFLSYLSSIQNGKYIKFNAIDLTHVKGLTYNVQANGAGGIIELHIDRIDGPLLSSITVPAGKNDVKGNAWKQISTQIKFTEGKRDLFFVFKGQQQNLNYFNMDWIRFSDK